MCPDKKRPAENTCRIVKGLDAVCAHFCPPKPCLPLSIDGTDIDEGAYERLRGKAIRDMKRTNGRISFKDALDFQKSV